jgi:hypothetical protein
MIEVKNLQLEPHEILALRREYEGKGLGDLAKSGHVLHGLDSLHAKLYSAISQPTFDKALDAHKPEGKS